MPEFLDKLFSWYDDNARDFPFRRTRDPYLIWLSEIIMQQTRIEQGVPYYNRFAEVFPDVFSLASADEESVLKQWQGLGYYSRARNLHSTAREVVEKYGGRFPESHEGLLALKGIGDYTAAAIASVCFDLPHPVMDGNVIRFITRHFGITGFIDSSATKENVRSVLIDLLSEATSQGRFVAPDASGNKPLVGRCSSVAEPATGNALWSPGNFNQAMIEFGALYCVPRNPDCVNCIFRNSCVANSTGKVLEIPAKKPAAALKTRHFNYLVIGHPPEKGYYFVKRTADDIWKGLYEFPLIETEAETDESSLTRSAGWKEWFGKLRRTGLKLESEVSHILSHQRIRAKFFRVETGKAVVKGAEFFGPGDLEKLPVHRLMEKFLRSRI